MLFSNRNFISYLKPMYFGFGIDMIDMIDLIIKWSMDLF